MRNFKTSLFAVTILCGIASASAAPVQSPDILLPPPQVQQPALTPPAVEKKLALPDESSKLPEIALAGVRIEGAKSLPEAELAAVFDPLLGKAATASELRAALDTINRKYAEAGFALGSAYIPAQDLTGGVLTVRVVEGHIGAVVVRTDTPRVKDTISRYASRLMVSRPLRTADLDRTMRLMAAIPGVTLSGALTNIDLATGAAVLVLDAGYQPLVASVTFDTHANVRGLPVQPYLTAQANNLFGDSDQIAVTGLLSPLPKKNYLVQLNAGTDLSSDGWRVSTKALFAGTDQFAFPADIETLLLRTGLEADYAWQKTTARQTDIAFGGFFSRAGYASGQTALAWDRYAAGYISLSDAHRFSPHWSDTMNVRATFGALYRYTGIVPNSRANAATDFAKLSWDGALLYAMDDRFSLLMRAGAQIASGSLIASEETGFGGNRFGRGYPDGIISGDHGIGLSLQPQYGFNLATEWRVSTYVFGDYAYAMNTKGDMQDNTSIVSAGIGFGVAHGEYALDLTLAQPLKSVGTYYRRSSPRVSGLLQFKV